MSLINAGPTVGGAADPCGTAVEDPGAAAVGVVETVDFVGAVVGLVEVVDDDLEAFVAVAAGAVVGFVTGGTAVGPAAFFVGAACGAQAASVKASTNTVLNRNLTFILFSLSWANECIGILHRYICRGEQSWILIFD
jgi:hypothetical protein